MCLTIAKEIHDRTEAIKCYKVLFKNADRFYSPFYDFEYRIGETYDAKGEQEITFYDDGSIMIEGGFFHSAKDLWSAAAAPWPSTNGPESLVIVECEIPTESLCFKGSWLRTAGYASTKLKLNRVVPKKEIEIACKDFFWKEAIDRFGE